MSVREQVKSVLINVVFPVVRLVLQASTVTKVMNVLIRLLAVAGVALRICQLVLVVNVKSVMTMMTVADDMGTGPPAMMRICVCGVQKIATAPEGRKGMFATTNIMFVWNAQKIITARMGSATKGVIVVNVASQTARTMAGEKAVIVMKFATMVPVWSVQVMLTVVAWQILSTPAQTLV